MIKVFIFLLESITNYCFLAAEMKYCENSTCPLEVWNFSSLVDPCWPAECPVNEQLLQHCMLPAVIQCATSL